MIESNSSHDDYAEIVDEEADYSSPSRDFELDRDCVDLREILGMISHKKSLITIFGHKHKIKNFIKKFGIFHKKISTAFDFGLYLE